MLLLRVQDAEDHDAAGFDPIKEFAGKTLSDYPAETTVINWPSLRRLLQHANGTPHFRQQLVTQTRPSGFLPSACGLQIRLHLRSNDDAPAHEREDWRNRASTSGQVEPASGFFR